MQVYASGIVVFNQNMHIVEICKNVLTHRVLCDTISSYIIIGKQYFSEPNANNKPPRSEIIHI